MIADPVGRECLLVLHHAIDRASARLSRDLAIPICVKDCGLCCWTVPMVRGDEISLVMRYLGSVPLVHLGVLTRIVRWLLEPTIIPRDGSSFAVIPDPYRGRALDRGVIGDMGLQLQTLLRSRCPLLDDEDRCLVYEVRPLVCRGYGVTCPADSFCKRPLAEGETQANRIFIQPVDDRGGQRASIDLENSLVARPSMAEWELLPTAIYRRWYPDYLACMSEKVATAKLFRALPAGPVSYVV